MKIVAYRILTAGNSFALEQQVNEDLYNGWQPYGAPVLIEGGSHYERHNEMAQAMVRYEEPMTEKQRKAAAPRRKPTTVRLEP